jgi:hypothetical protein
VKTSSVIVFLVVAFIVWHLLGEEPAHPSVTLGDPTVIASDPSAQLPGDYTTSDRSNMALQDDVVPK